MIGKGRMENFADKMTAGKVDSVYPLNTLNSRHSKYFRHF